MPRPSRGAASALALSVLIAGASSSLAAEGGGPGWVVKPTHHAFADLANRLDAAVGRHGMNVVNVASASEGARAQGIAIPGNRVVGVFRNDFARRLLALDLKAGIEAPIRFYLTEDTNGGATLSYRTPSAVLAPYVGEARPGLADLARELDGVFEAIATEAAGA